MLTKQQMFNRAYMCSPRFLQNKLHMLAHKHGLIVPNIVEAPCSSPE